MSEIAQILTALGGLGLFLIGMEIMTDGLRSLAGARLRRILQRNTQTPLRGVVSGALTTAMVQSSSATTVAVVGFVGAGLMSFQQSLGIIFGANIGTTLTGWIVALIGFKLQLGTALMPVALLGVLLRLFAPQPWRHVGWALAGFSVLFFGIDALQAGMAVFGDVITTDRFPADTVFGRLQLVGLGVVITVITQSSSAGVASALAALAAGAITFPQAAALVIGMDVGTTFSAALATLGGSTAARRTGFAHVIYNVLTAAMAFALLWPLGWLAQRAGPAFDAQVALVAFHSFFNTLGVVAVLGVANLFARLVIWLIPDRKTVLDLHLDPRLLADPGTALAMADHATQTIAAEAFSILQDVLRSGGSDDRRAQKLADLGQATADARAFLERIRATDRDQMLSRQLACLHALDHIDRLRHRCRAARPRGTFEEQKDFAVRVDAMKRFLTQLDPRAVTEEDEAAADAQRRALRDARESQRAAVFQAVADGEMSAEDAGDATDAVRWLQRVSYHLWRILHHLRHAEDPAQVAPAADRG
ncbi:MAG: Na/Pi cotransporter family protein [Rhodobacteraceae bacterium]|nr:Na/Pi cotransporter family protein [Paracoccaceae bacterium]